MTVYPSASAFPFLYNVSCKKNMRVAYFFEKNNHDLDRNLDSMRRLTEEEIEEATLLLELLLNIKPIELEDEHVWFDRKAHFAVKSVSQILNNRRRIIDNLGILNFPVFRV